MDYFIRLCIRSSVAFARQAIWLVAYLNAGAFVSVLMLGATKADAIPFAAGGVLAVIAAIMGFAAMQAEQMAHIASRDFIDIHQKCEVQSLGGPSEDEKAAVAHAAHRRTSAWRLTGDLRLVALAVVSSSLGSMIFGLFHFLAG